jgi:hypothetical protein
MNKAIIQKRFKLYRKQITQLQEEIGYEREYARQIDKECRDEIRQRNFEHEYYFRREGN